MDTQLNALPTLPVLARTVSGGVNSAFLNKSQHFTSHLFRPWMPSSARGIGGGGGPRRFTEVVLNAWGVKRGAWGGRTVVSEAEGREITLHFTPPFGHLTGHGLGREG